MTLPLDPEPCRCATPEQAKLCLRAGVPMVGRNYDLCRGQASPGMPKVTRSMSDAYRRRWDGLPQADEVRRRSIRCEFRTVEPVGKEEQWSCCGGSVTTVDTYGCACPARNRQPTTLAGCLRCEHHSPITGYVRQPGDPAVGLVIGSCGYPGLLELHVRATRQLCGETLPILISDDTDDENKAQRIYNLAVRYPNVTVWRNAEKLGHAPGDVVSLWKGLQWAQAHGLRVLVKVSNRMLWLTPRWLQDAARALLKSGHAITSMPCLQGTMRFAFRSECFGVDVLQWARPDLLAELEPSRLAAKGTWAPGRPDGMVAETFLWGIVDRLWGGRMTPWTALGEQRYESQAPAFLWHCADPGSRYAQAARDYGLDLGDEAARAGLGG